MAGCASLSRPTGYGLIKTDEGLFALLNGFIPESISQGVRDFVPRIHKRINKKSLANFTDINELDKRVAGLNENELDEAKTDIIKLYKNPPKDRFED